MSHKIDRGWLFTEFSCEDSNLKELGVEVQSWLPSGIKMDEIKAFKVFKGVKTTPEPEEGKVVVYTCWGDSFILNIEYGEFVTLFMKGVK